MPQDGGQGFVVHSPFQGSGCKGMTQRMDDLKVEAIYTELSNCIETHNYTLIELFKILSFAHKLSELGFTVDVDQYFHKVYNAINNMEPISKEQMRYFE